jgi:hypothetical protein
VITPEEEAERLTMRDGLIRTIDTIINLDAETARSMAEAFVDYFEARHTDLRLLDLEHRLGLVPEGSLLNAYRQVAYLDASVMLGATALTTVASRPGIGVARLRPRDAIVTLRKAAARYDGMPGMRRATVVTYVSRRFADLSTQGHGPQRHEGGVTRAMLEARVLRGVDPMTGTRVDGETGRPHFAVSSASRLRHRRLSSPPKATSVAAQTIGPRVMPRCLIQSTTAASLKLPCESMMLWGGTYWPTSKGLCGLARAAHRRAWPR